MGLRSFKPTDESMALGMATLAQEYRELLKELDGKAGECLSATLRAPTLPLGGPVR